MKKKLSILAVLLLAVTISAYSVGGTYAKYTTTANVTGTATVAKWNVGVVAKDGSGTATTTINLATGLNDANVAEGKIAPGTTKSFTFEVSSNDTQVSYNYSIVLSNFQNMPTNFTITGATHNENGTYTVPGGNILVSDTEKNKTATITWSWPFETTDGDDEDTTDGEAAKTMTFDATLVATQID